MTIQEGWYQFRDSYLHCGADGFNDVCCYSLPCRPKDANWDVPERTWILKDGRVMPWGRMERFLNQHCTYINDGSFHNPPTAVLLWLNQHQRAQASLF